MQTDFEQAIEIVQRLSPEEMEKLSEWIEAKRQNESPKTEAQNGDHVRRRRMEWFKANRERYGGQYVVLDGDKLLGVAKSYAEGREIAKNAGVAGAFVDYLSKPDEEGYTGGW